ncbi:serine protease [Actinoplanes sp. NBRC 14428]|nr:serine protease [Actinoplanes sp. NBRC 14428]
MNVSRKFANRAIAVATTALCAVIAIWLAPSADAIVGGKPVTRPYPWLANLSMSGVPDAESHICGASMITDQWAVTAAHCVDFDAESLAQIEVRVGSRNRLRGGEVRRIRTAIQHPNFHVDQETEKVTADLALIRLSARVAMPAVPLAGKVPAGTRTRIIGWGNTCSDPTPECDIFPAEARETGSSVEKASRCDNIDPAKEICTGYPAKRSGACSGDSGGPQIVADHSGHWHLVGVTSRSGHGETTCGQGTTIYTSVAAYRTWITETIKRN